MQDRVLHLSICDYEKNTVCPLYDNRTKITGQAYNVVENIERSGWKELSFSIPSVINTENGKEDNYVAQFLKAEYLIKAEKPTETEWYVISEPKISHNGFSKTIDVTAGHISQTLKMKNLGLEFSDDLGNNVGTAEQILDTILAGTGWSAGYVAEFREKRPDDQGVYQIKVRSLIAPTKTGAFKLINLLCTLFEAKPIFHGDSQTVDIVPLNPFGDYVRGTIPSQLIPTEGEESSDVLELHYGQSLKGVSRTLNNENMVTKLYMYGSYGDTTSGYCGLEECQHREITFKVRSSTGTNRYYYISYQTIENGQPVTNYYNFNSGSIGADRPVKDNELVLSLLDPLSKSYLYNKTKSTEDHALIYPLEEGRRGTALSCTVTEAYVNNVFPYVMGFDYYREIGLLTDDKLGSLALYQRKLPELLETTQREAASMADSQTKLAETIGSIDFVALSIAEKVSDSGYLQLRLDTDHYDKGVIYRSDYTESKKNYFRWRCCDEMDQNNEPLNNASSILYIVHNRNSTEFPTTWDTAYLKAIDDEDDPHVLTFWIESENVSISTQYDEFFLFSYNGINGRLGSLQSADESVCQSIDKATTQVTEKHPVIFSSMNPDSYGTDSVNGYAWYWHYDPRCVSPSEMYCCWKTRGDTQWCPVWFNENEPGSGDRYDRMYWYNWRASVLKQYINNSWQLVNSDQNTDMLVPSTYKASLTDQKVAALFPTVYMVGNTRDKYYQGAYEKYTHTADENNVNPGNYYFKDDFNGYHMFSLDDTIYEGGTITYNYVDGWVTTEYAEIQQNYPTKAYRFDNVRYHSANLLEGHTFQSGSISTVDGSLIVNTNMCRSATYIPVTPNSYISSVPQEYETSGFTNMFVHFYNDKRMWMSYVGVGANAKFNIAPGAAYIKIVISGTAGDVDSLYPNKNLHATGYEDLLIVDDMNYRNIGTTVPSESRVGIIQAIEDMCKYAHETYVDHYQAMKRAQEAADSLEHNISARMGIMWKEGWHQDDNYVDGDEDKLYDDALDTIEKISRPEASYTVDYLDLYRANIHDENFGIEDVTVDTEWPTYGIGTAVHLVDEEIGINEWAYLDKIQRCYDKPWETKITVNTNLTQLGQHNFSDVMSNIADVASEVKTKISKYDATSITSVPKVNLDELLADLVTMTKIVESAGGRITEFENELTGHSSMIKQSANEIRAEVRRATENEERVASLIITEDAIDSKVERKVTQELSNKIGYTVTVETPDGTFIPQDKSTISLIGKVYIGSEDYTSTISGNRFWWTRVTSDSDADTLWNNNHDTSLSAKSLTIGASDVGQQAVITMHVLIEEDEYTVPVTVVNITDQSSIEVYLASNQPVYQVYDSSTSSYTPDWSTSNLIITPSVFINGQEIPLSTSGLSVQWKRRVGNGQETDLALDEDVIDKSLHVSTNKLGSSVEMLTYVCTVSYEGAASRASLSYSLMNAALTTHTISILGSQAFSVDKTGSVSPSSIQLYTETVNCSVTKWQYKNSSGSWVDYPGANTGSTLTIVPNAATFVDDILTVRVLTNYREATDTFTIYKVYDGGDTLTAYLTNSNYSFVADALGRISYTTINFNIVAYSGATKVTPVLQNYSGNPAGMTVSVGTAVNNELPVTITIANNSTLGSASSTSGTVTFSLSYPENRDLFFNWSKLNKGMSINSVVSYYQASDNDSTAPTGIWSTSISDTTFGSTYPYLWTYEVVTDEANAVISSTTPSVLSVYRDEARSITNVVEEYASSSSKTTAPSTGWSQTAPSLDITDCYLWNREKIEYDRALDSGLNYQYTPARVIDSFSVAVRSVSVSYAKTTTYVTNPAVNIPSGSWQSTPPSVLSGEYLWTRTITDYTDGDDTVVYTYERQSIDGTRGPKGDAGTSVAVSSIKYIYSDSPSTHPDDSAAWETSVPATQSGRYLWTKTTFSTGEKAYSVAHQGSDGRSITSVTNYYCATETNTTPSSSETWYTDPGSTGFSSVKKYLWNYESIAYTSGSSDTTVPGIVGIWSKDGVGITSITEWYAKSTSNSTVTGTWVKTTPPVLDPVNRYLWNYEVVLYSDNSTSTTSQRIIGVYGDKGQDGSNGSDGKSITGVTNYYYASSSDSTSSLPSKGSASWKTTPTATTFGETDKYLWNYEVVTYSEGSPTSTDVSIIGVWSKDGRDGANGVDGKDGKDGKDGINGTNGIDGKDGKDGADGKGIQQIVAYYAKSTSGTVIPAQELFSTHVPLIDSNAKYLWNYEDVIYDDGSHGAANPRLDAKVIGVYGDKGQDGVNGTNGTNGADGISITGVDEQYQTTVRNTDTPIESAWASSATLTSTNKYLWNREIIHYSGNQQDTVTTPHIVGVYGDKGNDGEPAFTYGLYCPNGQIYNGSTTSIAVNSYQYVGGSDVSSSTTRVWSAYYGGQWHTLTGSGAAMNVSLVSGGIIVRCQFTYPTTGGTTYNAFIDLIDKTDNIDAVISSSVGSSVSDGTGPVSLRCALYQNGTEVDADDDDYEGDYTWTAWDKNGEEIVSEQTTGKTISFYGNVIDESRTYVCTAEYQGASTVSQYTLTKNTSIISGTTPPESPYVGMLWLDTSTTDGKSVNLLKRWDGTQWVETTMSYNDSQNLVTTVSKYNTRILQLEDSIQNTVTQTDYNVKISDIEGDLATKANSITTLQSEVRQNADDITASITTSKTYTDQELGKVTTSISNWMKFDANGLELGKSDSNFKAILSNNELAFYQGADKVSYINDNAMYITEARVTNTLSVGTQTDGWFDWVMTPQGLGMKWKV